MAELVDATDSKSVELRFMSVRVGYDRSASKLTFLTDLNNFTKKLDSKWPIKNILSKLIKTW